MLIPVLQATSGKTEEVRDQVGLNVYLYPDATQAETDELQSAIGQIPHVQSVEYVSKDEALAILSDRFESKNEDDLTEQLPGARNPLPASFNVKPDDLDNLASVRAALTPPGANGKPEADQPDHRRGRRVPRRGEHDQRRHRRAQVGPDRSSRCC